VDTTAEAKVAAEGQIDRSVTDWYKDAIIYQLHVKAFQDSTGDGVGDFAGLIQRLDHVESLGVNTVWLLPFYPSPLKDDGYDIADYQAINPTYGDMEQFETFIAEAHRRGMRVITELVINHTSDQHPWFERARAASDGSSERAFYVWSDTDTRYRGTRIIFIDTESSNWSWDPVAKAYYWHRFYAHQPDLNFENPRVFEEVTKALRFWLDKGVDGLRLDAVPYLCEREGTNNENLPETHEVLRRIRATIDDSYPDRMLLAEANQWPEDTRPYFGDGDECHMAFHFPLMPRMYMALAQEDRHPITDILRQTPEIPESCQWAIFLRNHDELTLEMVTDEERDYLWRVYATDSRARLNLGIRRRLAPLMANDRRKIELMNALLMSMPGTPVIYYGDEIGMGDNIYLGDRDGVRTPMQWSADRNGGFSRADPQRLYLPVIMDPVYGYQAVNVEAAQRDSASLLNWMRRLIQVRKQHRAFGRGSLSFLYPRNRKIVCYIRELGDEQILCIANLAASAQSADLDLSPWAGAVPVELLGRSAFPPIGTQPYTVMLQAYGFFWFLLTREAELPRWYTAPAQPLPEFVTLVLRDGLDSAISQRNQRQIEADVLPQYFSRQRWFAGKDTAIASTAINLFARFEWQGSHHLLTFVDVTLRDGRQQRYFLPLSARWGEAQLRADAQIAPFTLAKLREGPRIGAIFDSATDESLGHGLVRAMAAGEDLEALGGKLRFSCSLEIRDLLAELPEGAPVRSVGVEQSNSAVIIGERILLKIYRQPESGVQPELEVGRYLTEEAHFDKSPALLGVVECMPENGQPTAIAAAFESIENQGDAWGIIVEGLSRHLQQVALNPAQLPEKLVYPLDLGGNIGFETARMHNAFAAATGDPAFIPEPVSEAHIARWIERARVQAEAAFDLLSRSGPPAVGGSEIADLIDLRNEVVGCLEEFAAIPPAGRCIRVHGDYHLGQLLVNKTDVWIIDFEGEPHRPLAERREKTTPMRDVAGMLRSFDYAAWSALDRAAAIAPDQAAAMREFALNWRDAATAEFLSSYFAAYAGEIRSTTLKSDQQLLDLFLLHKAFYEIAYEAANRPGWLSIPVRGVMELLRRRSIVP
jgi:maltose alpha-D-glucosyltransferase/alpha-amylase